MKIDLFGFSLGDGQAGLQSHAGRATQSTVENVLTCLDRQRLSSDVFDSGSINLSAKSCRPESNRCQLSSSRELKVMSSLAPYRSMLPLHSFTAQRATNVGWPAVSLAVLTQKSDVEPSTGSYDTDRTLATGSEGVL